MAKAEEQLTQIERWRRVVNEAEHSFNTDDITPTRISELLIKLNEFGNVPPFAKERDFERLSFVFQECILQRIESISS